MFSVLNQSWSRVQCAHEIVARQHVYDKGLSSSHEAFEFSRFRVRKVLGIEANRSTKLSFFGYPLTLIFSPWKSYGPGLSSFMSSRRPIRVQGPGLDVLSRLGLDPAAAGHGEDQTNRRMSFAASSRRRATRGAVVF